MATIISRMTARPAGVATAARTQTIARPGRTGRWPRPIAFLMGRATSDRGPSRPLVGATDHDLATLAERATVEQRLERARADASVLIYGGHKRMR